MQTFSVKRTITNGLALAIPLGIIGYVFIRLVGIFEKTIAPVAKKLGIERLFGELTLTIISLFLMLLIVFILGLLMRLSFVAQFRRYLEEWILKLVPSLNHLKLIMAEKLDIENIVIQWKPVLLEKENKYAPAYIIEETEEWITLVYVKFPSTEPGEELLITKKSQVSYREISMKDMKAFNKQFGKGYISWMQTNM